MSKLCRRLVGWLVAVGCSAAGAQVLARPGWAGARVSRDPWWSHAVLYRVVPARFQDSDGDGQGDLGGVTERLEYLQALGIDALVVVMPGLQKEPDAAQGFDELTRQASIRHLRVMVEMTPDAQSDAVWMAEARFWLNQGAAGLVVSEAGLTGMKDAVRAASVLHQLRLLVGSFPGGRVLAAANATTDGPALAAAVTREAQLVLSPPVVVGTLLDAGTGSGVAKRVFRIRAEPPLAKAAAAVLLASANPVLIEAGQELGLGLTADGMPPLMQWTPTDVTVAPKILVEEKAVAEPEFKAFKPYVVPPPKSLVGELVKPVVVETDAAPAIDPELLPGFTTAPGAAALAGRLAVNGVTENVRDEERDPASVLSLYRRLVQLRHDDPALKTGSQVYLREEALGALVWVRQAGAETRVVVCNLSTAPLHLSLDAELARVKVRGGTMRDLVAGQASARNVQRTDDVDLAPGDVLVGRLYR